MKDRWILTALLIIFVGCAVVAAVVAGDRKEEMDKLKKQNHSLVVQNVQIKKEAFLAGVKACSEEDVDYLSNLADEYSGTALGSLLIDMAAGWQYDEENLDRLVNTYLTGVTTYE